MYRCKECGGVFQGGHFCVGKKHDSDPKIYTRQLGPEDQKIPEETVTIPVSEYLDLLKKAGSAKGGEPA